MIAETITAAILLAGANYADMRTTQSAFSACVACREANPLIGSRGERVMPVKVAATVAETAVFYAIRKRHKKTAWVYVATVVGVNLAIARHNQHHY